MPFKKAGFVCKDSLCTIQLPRDDVIYRNLFVTLVKQPLECENSLRVHVGGRAKSEVLCI